MLPDSVLRELDCLADEGAATRPIFSIRPDGLEAGLAALAPAQAAFLRGSGFTAAAGQLMLLPGPEGVAGAALGLGDDHSPYAHGALAMALPEFTAWRLEPGPFDMDRAVLGFCLGAYRFTAVKPSKRGPALVACDGASAGVLSAARAAWLVRDLVNMPANLLGPAELAAATQAIAARFGVAATLTEGDALMREFPAVAAVGAGSTRAPVVATFEWSGSGAGPEAPLVALCGKGVCFDSGGYDLKPAAGMLRMKKDMGGAALLLGLAAQVMAADLPVRLLVRIGCVENMVSGHAMRPMDVLLTRKGLTVEVGNTDAEGRLVLCDLLAAACEAKPDLVIDAATLTGAARVALGPDLPALFCNDSAFAAVIESLAEEQYDPVWRLPLHAGYESWLRSPVADLNNVASKPMAGAIVAALFMQRFVTSGTLWVHLDTYAWNDQSRPGRPEGGEALGLRAFFSVIKRLISVHYPDE